MAKLPRDFARGLFDQFCHLRQTGQVILSRRATHADASDDRPCAVKDRGGNAAHADRCRSTGRAIPLMSNPLSTPRLRLSTLSPTRYLPVPRSRWKIFTG